MNRDAKAWMAGVIEPPRGRIRFTNGTDRKNNQLVLTVRTSYVPLVQRLCELTGVKPDLNDAKTITYIDRRACTVHCPEAHVHVSEADIPEHAVWAISGVGAAIVLHNLIPHMLTTQGLQTIVDNILTGLPKGGRGRFQVDQTIIRLKKLGWNIPSAALEGFIAVRAKRGENGRFIPPCPQETSV